LIYLESSAGYGREGSRYHNGWFLAPILGGVGRSQSLKPEGETISWKNLSCHLFTLEYWKRLPSIEIAKILSPGPCVNTEL
jgi:hypothetical protein